MSSVSGILPLDKPAGPTSHDVVAGVRKALGIRRVGHTGTLDPFASGLLLVCVGPSTRLAEYLSPLDKVYTARVQLGVATATHDLEGDVVSRSEGWREVGRDAVESALEEFRGTILQRPPAFSAKKVAGEPAHRRARRGESVRLAPVEVTVHELELTAFEPPEIGLRVRCSAGTYVRALGRDLGEALEVGAHLTALRRTEIGSFSVDRALTPADVEDREAREVALIPPGRAMAGFPALRVEADQALRLSQGQFLEVGELPGAGEGDPVAIFLDDELVAVALVQGGRLRPKKVLAVG